MEEGEGDTEEAPHPFPLTRTSAHQAAREDTEEGQGGAKAKVGLTRHQGRHNIRSDQ